MRRANSLENTLMLGKLEGRSRRGRKRMRWVHGIIESMHMSSSKLREIVEDREAWLLQSMGWQGVRHNLVTEWQDFGLQKGRGWLIFYPYHSIFLHINNSHCFAFLSFVCSEHHFSFPSIIFFFVFTTCLAGRRGQAFGLSQLSTCLPH